MRFKRLLRKHKQLVDAECKYSRLPITRTIKGNRKSSSYQEFEKNSRN